MQKGFIRLPKMYTTDDILRKVTLDNPCRITLDGQSVKIHTIRLFTLKRDNGICRHCNLQGKAFFLEKDSQAKSFHLNLYGFRPHGYGANQWIEEVLLTCDHVIPRSKGGANHISNTQTLCYHYNQKKADKNA